MSAGILHPSVQVDHVLDGVRRQIIWHTLIRGLAIVVTVSLSAVLLATVCDYVFGLSAIVRASSLAAAIGVTGWAAWRHLFVPLSEAIPRTQLAAAVDLSCPDLDESLATLLSLEHPEVTTSEAGSEFMRRRLQAQVSERMAKLPSDSVVDSRETRRRGSYAGLAIMAALLPLLLWPSGSKLLLQRMIVPFGNLATATNLYFEVESPNRTVARGSTVQFTATPEWRTGSHSARPEVVNVELLAAAGRRESLGMVFDELAGHYVTELTRIEESIEYQIVGGGAKTEVFSILVVDAPQIQSAALTAVPPAYTGQAVRQFDGVLGRMEVFERSDLEIQLTFNKPVEAASLLWIRRDPRPLSEVAEFNLTFDHLTGEEVVKDLDTDWDPSRSEQEKVELSNPEDQDPDAPLLPKVVPLARSVNGTLSSDGMSAIFQMQADVGGDFIFEISDEYQLLNADEPERTLEVIYDTPPELIIRSVRSGDRFRADDVLPVDALAVDDIGIGALELHYRINDEVTRIIPANEFEAGSREVANGFRIDLPKLGVENGAAVSLRLRVADERPEPGRQETWSQEFTLQISDDAQAAGADAMAEEAKAIVDALKQLEAEVAADQQAAEVLEQKSQRDWNEQARNEAARLSEKEQQQGRLLEKVAQRVATHPLMQDAATDLKDIANSLKHDIPQTLDDASTTDRKAARQKMKTAEEELETAHQALSEQVAKIEEIAELEQDLAELNRLALEAEQLAADANQLDEDRRNGDNRPQELNEAQWDEALDNRRLQLAAEQQELTDELQRLLEEEKQLLDAAQRSQQEQLAEVAEAAQRLAQQQQNVAEGVKQEAKEAGQRAREIANELDDVRKIAEQLNQQLQQETPSVERPDTSALKQAVDELRDGNLAQPQSDVQQAAEEMQALNQQLQQPAAADDADASESRQQNAATAEQMADQLQNLNDQILQLRQERNASTAKDATPQNADANNNAAKEEAVNSLLERMQELADVADEMARQAATDPSASKSAQQEAQQAADRSSAATDKAQAGDFAKAAQQMRSAGDAAQEASEQMQSPDQSPGPTDQQQQMAGLGEEMDRTAQALDNMRLDDAAQAAAQQQTQQEIAQQAADLPQQLSDLSERLNMQALQMAEEAQQAEQAQQAAEEAQQSSQQASSGLQSGQLQQAAQSGQQAAEQLQQVADATQQGGQSPASESEVIPSEVGESVADALQDLAQAAQAMQQQSPPGREGQPGEPDQSAEQAANGQRGQQASGDQSVAGEGQSAEPSDSNQSEQQGQGQPSQGQPSGSQQLSSAAESLAQAAQQALPNQFTPGQSGQGSESSSAGADGNGNTAMWDGLLPGKSAGPADTRDWGQLNEELDTETSGDVRVSRDSEYQALIRMYFREVARESTENEK